MKLKTFTLALLLAIGALVASIPTMADPVVVPQLTCIKAQSDVALHLRVTNNGTSIIAKGKKINYAYKTAANSSETKGTMTLENALAPGQSRSFFVVPQAGHDTPIYQCTAAVKALEFSQQPQPKNP
jgi:type IV secretory pathway TrbL component